MLDLQLTKEFIEAYDAYYIYAFKGNIDRDLQIFTNIWTIEFYKKVNETIKLARNFSTKDTKKW